MPLLRSATRTPELHNSTGRTHADLMIREATFASRDLEQEAELQSISSPWALSPPVSEPTSKTQVLQQLADQVHQCVSEFAIKMAAAITGCRPVIVGRELLGSGESSSPDF